jgi:hypothetical protein
VWKFVDGHRYGTQRDAAVSTMLGHAMLIGVLFSAQAAGVARIVEPGDSEDTGHGGETPAPRVGRDHGRGANLSGLCAVGAAPARRKARGARSAPCALLRDAISSRARFSSPPCSWSHLPSISLLARADRVAARFSPETVLQLMLGSVTLEMVTAFILFAGVTELVVVARRRTLVRKRAWWIAIPFVMDVRHTRISEHATTSSACCGRRSSSSGASTLPL